MANSPKQKEYRDQMQKTGFKLQCPQYPVPNTPNPVSKNKPALGGTPVPHPFKKGKASI